MGRYIIHTNKVLSDKKKIPRGHRRRGRRPVRRRLHQAVLPGVRPCRRRGRRRSSAVAGQGCCGNGAAARTTGRGPRSGGSSSRSPVARLIGGPRPRRRRLPRWRPTRAAWTAARRRRATVSGNSMGSMARWRRIVGNSMERNYNLRLSIEHTSCTIFHVWQNRMTNRKEAACAANATAAFRVFFSFY